MYNVPETADSQGAGAFDSLLIKSMPDCHDVAWGRQRLGTYCLDQKRPRPVHMIFDTNKDKHTFLKHTKHLKELGLRYDDDSDKVATKPEARVVCRFQHPEDKRPQAFLQRILILNPL